MLNVSEIYVQANEEDERETMLFQVVQTTHSTIEGALRDCDVSLV